VAAIYEKSTRLLMADAAAELTPPFTQRQVVDWFGALYPKLKPGSIVSHITFLTANNRNRRHHNYMGSQPPVFFRTPEGLVPYDEATHGSWNNQGELVSEPGDPLEGFTTPVPFTWASAIAAPSGSAVHAVLDENGEVAFVGLSGRTSDRLKDHLRGDRQASALHNNLGEELDEVFGEPATSAEIEEHLGSWSVCWIECPTEETQPRKDRLIGLTDPRLNRRGRAVSTHWWVNQGRSYESERDGEIVFAGTGAVDRTAPAHHRNVTRLRPGNIVLHYARGEVLAVGVVTGTATAMRRPYGPVDERDDGNAAPVRYHELTRPIALEEITPRLASDGPFDKNGTVKQQYLMPIDRAFVERFARQFADRLPIDIIDPEKEPKVNDDLESLIARFRAETGYPTARDQKISAQRPTLAAHLTPDGLDLLAEDLAAARRFLNKFASGAYGSPGNQSNFNRGLQSDERVGRAIEAIRFLLTGAGEVGDRIQAVLSDPDHKVLGFKEALITKVFAVTDPAHWVPNYSLDRKKGKRQVIRALKLAEPDVELSTGQQIVVANDRLYQALAPHFGADAWGMQEFGWWLCDQTAGDDDDDEIPGRETLAQLAKRLYVPEDFLERAVRLLQDRRQVVFYGPPGTGKTYLARELAAFLAADGEVTKVQFHPSYSYEDFIEGYRPRVVDGVSTFDLVDGPLKEIAAAASDSDHRHVLLIDELNRGNVAKILGELYFLLEYRDEEMRLQYSQAPFALPEKLWIIATMNTADRSIALVDAALRRRFHFIPFFPDKPPVEGLLRRWLTDHTPAMAWVADLVDHANAQLGNRHLAIGPSHFLRSDLDEEWLDLVWEHSVIPYLAEQFFGDEGRLDAFALTTLRASMGAGTSGMSALVDGAPIDPAESLTSPGSDDVHD
jgi:hypothetical protein